MNYPSERKPMKPCLRCPAFTRNMYCGPCSAEVAQERKRARDRQKTVERNQARQALIKAIGAE